MLYRPGNKFANLGTFPLANLFRGNKFSGGNKFAVTPVFQVLHMRRSLSLLQTAVLHCTVYTVHRMSYALCTLDFIPRSHQPIRFVVTSSHANLIGSCDPGSVTITSDLQRYLAS